MDLKEFASSGDVCRCVVMVQSNNKRQLQWNGHSQGRAHLCVTEIRKQPQTMIGLQRQESQWAYITDVADLEIVDVKHM